MDFLIRVGTKVVTASRAFRFNESAAEKFLRTVNNPSNLTDLTVDATISAGAPLASAPTPIIAPATQARAIAAGLHV